jgi:hypothetical protein
VYVRPIRQFYRFIKTSHFLLTTSHLLSTRHACNKSVNTKWLNYYTHVTWHRVSTWPRVPKDTQRNIMYHWNHYFYMFNFKTCIKGNKIAKLTCGANTHQEKNIWRGEKEIQLYQLWNGLTWFKKKWQAYQCFGIYIVCRDDLWGWKRDMHVNFS